MSIKFEPPEYKYKRIGNLIQSSHNVWPIALFSIVVPVAFLVLGYYYLEITYILKKYALSDTMTDRLLEARERYQRGFITVAIPMGVLLIYFVFKSLTG